MAAYTVLRAAPFHQSAVIRRGRGPERFLERHVDEVELLILVIGSLGHLLDLGLHAPESLQELQLDIEGPEFFRHALYYRGEIRKL